MGTTTTTLNGHHHCHHTVVDKQQSPLLTQEMTNGARHAVRLEPQAPSYVFFFFFYSLSSLKISLYSSPMKTLWDADRVRKFLTPRSRTWKPLTLCTSWASICRPCHILFKEICHVVPDSLGEGVKNWEDDRRDLSSLRLPHHLPQVSEIRSLIFTK